MIGRSWRYRGIPTETTTDWDSLESHANSAKNRAVRLSPAGYPSQLCSSPAIDGWVRNAPNLSRGIHAPTRTFNRPRSSCCQSCWRAEHRNFQCLNPDPQIPESLIWLNVRYRGRDFLFLLHRKKEGEKGRANKPGFTHRRYRDTPHPANSLTPSRGTILTLQHHWPAGLPLRKGEPEGFTPFTSSFERPREGFRSAAREWSGQIFGCLSPVESWKNDNLVPRLEWS